MLALEGHPTKVKAFWSACHSDTHHYYLAKPPDPFVVGRPEGFDVVTSNYDNHPAFSSLVGKAKKNSWKIKRGGGGSDFAASAFAAAAAAGDGDTRLVPTPAKGECFNPYTCPTLATPELSSSDQQSLTSGDGGGEKKAAAAFTMRKPCKWRLEFAAHQGFTDSGYRRWNVRTRPMRTHSTVVGTLKDGDVIHATAVEVMFIMAAKLLVVINSCIVDI